MNKLKQQHIPTHRIETQSALNLEFTYMEMTDEYIEMMLKSDKNVIHRDDYYMFLFLESGSATFAVDFEEIQLCEKSIFYIRPGQIHFASSIHNARGWFLAIDAMLIQNDYKNLFGQQFSTQECLCINDDMMRKMRQAAHLLHSSLEANQKLFSKNIISNLANVFIGFIAEQYAQQLVNLQHNQSRSTLIVYQFRDLLAKHFKSIKSPSQYAQMLNYSLSHLNELVKNFTGSPVSYWIHQQVILEAKRMLYYTDMDVKEIAFKLGYEDHTYFSRLFSKIAGISPRAFRNKFRE